ncbi:hypothetical protein CEP51_012463 [Fusarium floridanum]|uniref:Uncharacterized protein n=1 Tax=Fusarium floridanum TaxID=1325733 RepID=A0A428QTF5_9HYPO|nr:hypothetical protein CEP51_012463 [Fusarium floridanum]
MTEMKRKKLELKKERLWRGSNPVLPGESELLYLQQEHLEQAQAQTQTQELEEQEQFRTLVRSQKGRGIVAQCDMRQCAYRRSSSFLLPLLRSYLVATSVPKDLSYYQQLIHPSIAMSHPSNSPSAGQGREKSRLSLSGTHDPYPHAPFSSARFLASQEDPWIGPGRSTGNTKGPLACGLRDGATTGLHADDSTTHLALSPFADSESLV